MSGRALLGLALACHLVFATGYLLRMPVFEGPDESDHMRYARQLLEHGGLPVIPGSSESVGYPLRREAALAHHPPLYYLGLAAAQRALGAGDLAVTVGFPPEREGPSEAYIHQWQHGYDEVAPVSREVRVLWVLRGFSVLCGLVSLLLVYRLGRLTFPGRPAVAGVAALLVACLPQWSFVHGVLDNGNPATALSLAVLCVLAVGLRDRRLSVRRGIGLGLLLGVTLLTKLTAVFLVPVAGVVYLIGLARWRDERRSTLFSGLALLGTAALVSGAFFWRNTALYGDPLGSEPYYDHYSTNAIPDELRWTYFTGAEYPKLGWGGEFFRITFLSLVGHFGWGRVAVPEWVLWIGRGLGAFALVGWLVRGRRLCEAPARVLLLVLAAAVILASLIQFNLIFYQPQGRYLFPGLGAMALLLAAGLVGAGERLAPFLARPAPAAALALAPAAVAAWVLFGFAAPAFQFEPSPDHPYYAVLTADLSTPPPPERGP